jgi:acid phosphatase type 7
MRIWPTLATLTIAIGAASPSFAQTGLDPKPIGILLAVGDISSCGKEKWTTVANDTARLVRDAIKEAEAADPPIPYRVIVLGDLAYETGAGNEFTCFEQRWTFDDVVTKFPKNEIMLPVPGNHEYQNKKAGKITDAQPYFDHFKNHPLVNQTGTKKGYYALNFPRADGPWRLIGLNDNFASSKKYKQQLAEQAAWLEKDLTAESNQQNCLLAFWHAPTFSSGKHGHGYVTNKDAKLSGDRHMKDAFALLHGHGASVVLNGHEHSYEQFRPQNAAGKPVDDGVRLFVVGTGGKQLTTDEYDNVEESSEGGAFGLTRGNHGVMKIRLFENRYEWVFLPINKTHEFDLKTKKDDCRKRK